MRDFIIAQRLEERASKKKKSKKHNNETPEEKRARKERKREKKAKKKLLQGKSEAMRGVEELLNSLGVPGDDGRKMSPRGSRGGSPSSRRDRYESRRGRSPEPHSSHSRRRDSSGPRSPRR
jgi:RNA-binding motif X-linked protein 2